MPTTASKLKETSSKNDTKHLENPKFTNQAQKVDESHRQNPKFTIKGTGKNLTEQRRSNKTKKILTRTSEPIKRTRHRDARVIDELFCSKLNQNLSISSPTSPALAQSTTRQSQL